MAVFEIFSKWKHAPGDPKIKHKTVDHRLPETYEPEHEIPAKIVTHAGVPSADPAPKRQHIFLDKRLGQLPVTKILHQRLPQQLRPADPIEHCDERFR
jgi:hypothetical protein